MNPKKRFPIVSFLIFALSSCGEVDFTQREFDAFRKYFADAYPSGFAFEDGWYRFAASSAGFGEGNVWNPDGFVARCYAKLRFTSEAQETMAGKTNNGSLKAVSLQAHFEKFEMHIISGFIGKEYSNPLSPIYDSRVYSLDAYYDNGSFYYRYCRYIADDEGLLQFDGSESCGGTSIRCDDPYVPIVTYPLYHADEWRSANETGRLRYDILSTSSLKAVYYSHSALDNYSMQYLLQPDGYLREIECTYGRTNSGITNVTTITMRPMEEMKVEVPRSFDVDITGSHVYGLALDRPIRFGYYIPGAETAGKEGAQF